jgi:ABC-2 type transport system permease protein
MAGVGAIAPTQRDGQQMSVIFTLFAMIPYFLMPFIIENENISSHKILTIFPLTAPLTAMMRINGGIPAWNLRSASQFCCSASGVVCCWLRGFPRLSA